MRRRAIEQQDGRLEKIDPKRPNLFTAAGVMGAVVREYKPLPTISSLADESKNLHLTYKNKTNVLLFLQIF